MGDRQTAIDWILKYILPGIMLIIIPATISATKNISTVQVQQVNNTENISNISKQVRIHNVDISQIRQSQAKTEVLLDTINKSITTLTDNYRDNNKGIIKEMRKQVVATNILSEKVAILSDRSERKVSESNEQL